MGKGLVCLCNFVTENEIVTILKKGAVTASEIQYITKAGTGCGRCLPVIDGIVEEYTSNLPDDPQQKINFDTYQ